MYLKGKRLLLVGILLCSLPVFGQTATGLAPLIQNVYNRERIMLNGYWNYFADPLETGYYDYRRRPSPDGFFKDQQVDNVKTWKEYDFDTAPVMGIPGDWNTHDDNLFLYEGTIWFRHLFLYSPKGNNPVYLYFAASNYDTKVYLNGKKVGEHEGGYTPFNFDVTDIIRSGQNNLIVKVDNKRREDAVPANNFDWFNYGGITRDVMLVELPPSFIRSYKIQLKKGTANTLETNVQLSEKQAGLKVNIAIPELKINQQLSTDESGVASGEIKGSPSLWSPESPKLYTVNVSSSSDKVNDEIGFRTIETKGREILLNGKRIFLKGISIHEEAAFRNGRIYSEEEDRTLLNWAKELGCNYVRLAHYPHNEQMVRLAEKLGLLVWSEIPVYWTIQWEKEYVYANALNQLDEMIERDQNRANVIIWSIANETPHSDARDKFLSSLAKYARNRDNTRLISMAMERKDKSNIVLSINDNMSEFVDIVSVNQYVGWYDGTNEKLDRVRWEIDYDKPLIISEFGGDAVQGYHGDDSRIWTEEYQAELFRKTLKMIDERMPYVSGISPWILKDFRSSRRLLPNIQDGFNRKGIISDRGNKKQAFYILQQWYKNK
jgi:beta-glucuronidase